MQRFSSEKLYFSSALLYIFEVNVQDSFQNESNLQIFFCPTAKTAPLSVPALQATMREPALLSPGLSQQDCVSVCAFLLSC